MAIKAIALDIDGTLTNDEKRITPRTREALLAAQETGIKLILASGRPAQGLKALGAELELPTHGGIYAAFGGASVESAETGECYFSQAIPSGELRRLIEHLKSFDLVMWFNEGRNLYLTDAFAGMIHDGNGELFNVIKYERDACDLRIVEIDDLLERADNPQCKLLTAADPDYLQAHYEEMSAPFKDTLAASFTAPFYYEFMAPGVDKAHALECALGHLGISASEVVAFGDSNNDASMLAWAGTGVAMGNAVDETKAAANMVTLDNNHDGIAEALTRLL